jgi:hypothetical protein
MTQLKVQDVACNLILQNPSMTAENIAALVREQIPTCKCSADSIAWYRSKLRQGKISGFPVSLDKPIKNKTLKWPEWSQPSDDEFLYMAKITIPYICFLHPDIVRKVVEDNEVRRDEWSDRLKKRGIDPALYLWQHSPCAFPGVRRYAGGSEIAQYRGRMERTAGPANALKLDDNDYPKHIWSFVFRGKPFQKFGPSGYSLAHLVDHKKYGNRGQDELTSSDDKMFTLTLLFGLYTSVTNTVYMPNGLIRPTDFSFVLRNLLQRQANALYGNFCKLLPPHLSLRISDSEAWSLSAFSWREPVGTSDHLEAFLRFRSAKMEMLFKALTG